MAIYPHPQDSHKAQRFQEAQAHPLNAWMAQRVGGALRFMDGIFLAVMGMVHGVFVLGLLLTWVATWVEASGGGAGEVSIPPSLLAQQEIPGVARSLPMDASILLLTSIPFPIPFPLYTYPRSCRILLKQVPGVEKALDESLVPAVAQRVRRYFKDLRMHGGIWERGPKGDGEFLKALALVDYVILFGFAGKLPTSKLPASKRLVRMKSFAWGALYRVQGRDGKPGEGRKR